MKEVVRVKLENEMDLILAHKRAMRLGELTGSTLIQQTSVATAISEIARCAIEFGKQATLILGIETSHGKKWLRAIISDGTDFSGRSTEPISYARRLVETVEIIKGPKDFQIVLRQQLNFAGILTDGKIQSFVEYFKNEPPLSAYDELRRKNLLLQDLADKIRESENEYRILTDSLPLMMFASNPRGVITFSNRWFQDFAGIVPSDLSSASWQTLIHPSDHTQIWKRLTLAVQRQTAFSGEVRIKQRSSGEYVWHLFSIVPLKNEKDIPTQWIGFLVDINAQKVVEQTLKDNRELKQTQEQLFIHQEELQRKVVELNRSNHELEQFAHLASHDLQEPLRKLFFYSDVLKRKYADKIDESGSLMLNNMVLAASRMKELITDLLTYSQIQKQKMPFELVDLEDVVNEIVRDLDVVVKEKNAVIEIPELPQLMGNRVRLRQLFTNLISNSLKYSRKDVAPHIKIDCHSTDEMVFISVRDNGIGFEEHFSEKIFGLFERLHTRDKYPGTGIGLSICKRIVELHGGRIHAKSKPDEGSVFEVSLPISQHVAELAE